MEGSRSATPRGPCEALIDRAALRANFALAERLAEGRAVIAVVKADAYGHGAALVAPALAQAGCRHFAVLTADEGEALRAAGIDAPVLLLGGVRDDEEAALAVRQRLTPVVHDAVELERIGRAAGATPLPVHVEVDTGMRRMGVPPGAAAAFLARVAATPGVRLAGTHTHLARADEPDLAPSLAQLQRFREVLAAARAAGVDPGVLHVANSAGLLVGKQLFEALPEVAAVRPGLMLYGVRPAPHLAGELQPVMTLRTRVRLVRDVRAGEPVGYAALYHAPRDTRIATLPLGYADGVPVAATRGGRVWIGGRRHPIAGRVSMDSVTVDVGDAPVAPGDEAIVFGGDATRGLPVEEAAAAVGTIPYELLVRVGTRVRRVAIG